MVASNRPVLGLIFGGTSWNPVSFALNVAVTSSALVAAIVRPRTATSAATRRIAFKLMRSPPVCHAPEPLNAGPPRGAMSRIELRRPSCQAVLGLRRVVVRGPAGGGQAEEQLAHSQQVANAQNDLRSVQRLRPEG